MHSGITIFNAWSYLFKVWLVEQDEVVGIVLVVVGCQTNGKFLAGEAGIVDGRQQVAGAAELVDRLERSWLVEHRLVESTSGQGQLVVLHGQTCTEVSLVDAGGLVALGSGPHRMVEQAGGTPDSQDWGWHTRPVQISV